MDICAMCHEAPGDARLRNKGFIETVVNEKKRAKKGKKSGPAQYQKTSFHYHVKCYPHYKIKLKGAGQPCPVTGYPILEVRKLNSEIFPGYTY